MFSLIKLLSQDWNHEYCADLFRETRGGKVQTEIDYREVGNKVEFVAFRNVLNLDDIEEVLGGHGGIVGSGYMKYIGGGRAFYALYDNNTTTIRIFSEKEINPQKDYNSYKVHYKDYFVGTQYSQNEWNHFIQWLKDAGERFTEIKHKKAEVQTIVI